MSSKKSDKRGWLAFNTTPLLDLFMLATFVFAMNADKGAEQIYGSRLDAATNEVQRASSQLDELKIKNTELETLVSIQSNKLEIANAENRANEVENRNLQTRVNDLISSKTRLESDLSDATNRVGKLEAANRDLSNDIEDYVAREKEYEKLDKFRNESRIETGDTNIDVSVFVGPDSRLFWKNNFEWSWCSLEKGLDDFLKAKSFPDGIQIQIRFIGFHNCASREASVIITLEGKFKVLPPARKGCHLIYWCSSDRYIVDNRGETQDLSNTLVSVADADRRTPPNRVKYFLVRPKSEDSTDKTIKEKLKMAYGREIDVEIIRY